MYNKKPTNPSIKNNTRNIFRKLRPILSGFISIKVWAEQDSNLRRLTPADLQSAPVDRFGIDPII